VNVGECSPELWVGTGHVTVTEINYQDSNGFNTDDYTAIPTGGITTVAPGAPNQQLVWASESDRSAIVNVSAGGKSQGTTVKFDNELVQGYYEICKTQVAGANLSGTFHFDVQGANGYSAGLDVPVGGCSFPTLAPAGHVNIQEDKGTNTYVDTLQDPVDHTWGISSSTGDLLDFDIADATVTYRNNASLLKICKVVDTDSGLQGLSYKFNVDGTWYTVHSYSFYPYDSTKVYGCVLVANQYRSGSQVTVTEQPQAGQALDHIWFEPGGDPTSGQGGNDYTGQSITFDLHSGMNEVFFKNAPVAPQLLKICKTSGTANTSVTYNVAGPVGEAPDVTNGMLSVSVPLDSTGAGCAEAGLWAYIGPVTVTESIPAGQSVTAITANGDDANGNRLGSADLATGTAVVWIGAGTTIVTYTNGGAAAGGTTTGSSTGGSSSSSSSSGGSSSASTGASAATASTASTSAPTKVTPAKTAKVAATASVSSVRIVTINKGRYVVVRIAGTAKTVRIHVTLIGANHQVLKTMTRYVATNKSARVGNLRLGAKVSAVRIAL
jgi:hypothetical protein